MNVTLRDMARNAGLKNVRDYVEAIATDFVYYAKQLWLVPGLGGAGLTMQDVAPIGAIEEDILWYADNGPQHRELLAWRGIGKTHLVTGALGSYRVRQNPDIKILLVSKTLGDAKQTLHMVRGWIQVVPFLNDLDPDHYRGAKSLIDREDRFEVNGCEVGRSPTFLGMGVDGQLPGKRAHLVLGDDVETPENTKTVQSRADLVKTCSEFKAIASYGREEVVIVGTFHHDESVYKKLPKKGYDVRTWTIEGPEEGDQHLGLAPMQQEMIDRGEIKPGEVFSPRITPERQAALKAEGTVWYARQCKLQTNVREGADYPLRLQDLIVVDHIDREQAPVRVFWGRNDHLGSTVIDDIDLVCPEDDYLLRACQAGQQPWAPFTGTKAFIDVSGRGADHTGICIMSHLAGLLWMKFCRGVRGGHDEPHLEWMAMLFRTHDVREIYIEQNWGGAELWTELFQKVLRKFFIEPGEDAAHPHGWKASIVDDKKITFATAQKEKRVIGILEPVLSNHKIITSREAIRPQEDLLEHQELQYQITHITAEPGSLEEDGAIDAMAGCTKAWTHEVGIDTERVAQDVEEQEQRKRVEQEHARVLGLRDRRLGRRRDVRTFRHH